jgi:hypothetical protein
MRFTFTAEDEYEDGDYQRVTKEFQAETWHEALAMFEEFLRGCGYVFEGQLDLVQEEKVHIKSEFNVTRGVDWD